MIYKTVQDQSIDHKSKMMCKIKAEMKKKSLSGALKFIMKRCKYYKAEFIFGLYIITNNMS